MSTSVSQSHLSQSGNPQSQNRRSSNAVRNWITATGVILMLLVGFFVIRTQGHVSGVEFAPSHFQIRDFSFYEIPLLHHQITPIHRKTRTSATANYLRQKSLIPSTIGPAQNWHLVSISRGLTGTTAADASFLVDQLELRSSGKDYWRQWSIDHPTDAAWVWPEVQKLADRELYVLIPALLELISADPGKAGGNTKALQSKIDEYLQEQYLKLIRDMAAADREPLAAALLAEARSDYPQNQDLQTIEIENPDWAELLGEVKTPEPITP